MVEPLGHRRTVGMSYSEVKSKSAHTSQRLACVYVVNDRRRTRNSDEPGTTVRPDAPHSANTHVSWASSPRSPISFRPVCSSSRVPGTCILYFRIDGMTHLRSTNHRKQDVALGTLCVGAHDQQGARRTHNVPRVRADSGLLEHQGHDHAMNPPRVVVCSHTTKGGRGA